MTNKQYKIDEEDKVELLREFLRLMIDFGYTPEYIGREMAYIARAIEQASSED